MYLNCHKILNEPWMNIDEIQRQRHRDRHDLELLQNTIIQVNVFLLFFNVNKHCSTIFFFVLFFLGYSQSKSAKHGHLSLLRKNPQLWSFCKIDSFLLYSEAQVYKNGSMDQSAIVTDFLGIQQTAVKEVPGSSNIPN